MLVGIERLKLKAKLYRGFADPTRLAILEGIKDGEKTVSEIVSIVKKNQSNISNHLSCLLDCGIVTNRRNGKNVFYDIKDKRIISFLSDTDKVLADLEKDIFECSRYS